MPGRLLINYAGKDGAKFHDSEFNSAMQGDAVQQVAVCALVGSGENLRCERISCVNRLKANNIIADISRWDKFMDISNPFNFQGQSMPKNTKQ